MNANINNEAGGNLVIMLAGTVAIAALLGIVVPRLFGSSPATKIENSAHHQTATEGQSMGGMKEHMQKMREHMAQMRATTDPQERQRLMDAHMAKMEDMMKMMESMGMNMGGMMGSGGMAGMNMGASGMAGMKHDGMNMGGSSMSGMKHEGMNRDHGNMTP